LLRRINSVRTKDQPPSHSVAARSDPRAWAVGPARFINRVPAKERDQH
jgi:hypothetical protein